MCPVFPLALNSVSAKGEIHVAVTVRLT